MPIYPQPVSSIESIKPKLTNKLSLRNGLLRLNNHAVSVTVNCGYIHIGCCTITEDAFEEIVRLVRQQ